MSRKRYLFTTVCALLLFFALGRIGFMLNNSFISPCSWTEYALALVYGIPQDLVIIFWVMIYPFLVVLSTVTQFPKLKIRRWLVPYFVLVGLLLTVVLMADGVMYEHWGFKLDNCIYSYASSPGGAASSVALSYVLGVACVLVVSYTICLCCLLPIIPKGFAPMGIRRHSKEELMMGLRCCGAYCLLAFPIGFVNVGTSYWSDTLFLNHVSTNSIYNLVCSMMHDSKEYNRQFVSLSDEEATQLVNELYPADQLVTAVEDTLLNTQTPNILFIQLESCGAVFVEALGGAKEASPNLTRYANEGISFDRVYASSFRTDRSTVSALSAYLSYPTASLMLMPKTLDKLPSLAHTLAERGYSTAYQYGGQIEGMGKGNYLRHAGFQQLISAEDYALSDEESTNWGVSDSLSFHRVFDFLMEREQSGKPWLFGQQAIDSHEPWNVPFHACENPVFNAFAYTDHHMGLLIERLKQSPLWDNLLIIIYADHGFLYQQTYQDPEFFHIPVVWTGGAVRQPRRISTLMSQSDIIPTLLAQMGIPRQNYPWGHDVMTSAYRKSAFAYSNFPAGVMFSDQTGTTILDIHAHKPIYESDKEHSALRQRKIRAILQKSYDELQELNR